MATITYSPLVVAASGSVKDTVFSRWKGRPYIRARVVPTYRNTPDQIEYRSRLRAAVKLWQTQHADLVEVWQAWAAPYRISGFNASTALNCQKTAKRMAIADVLVPAITPLNAAAPEFIIDSFPPPETGTITVTWITNYTDAEDFVYMAALSESGLTYYNGLAKPAQKAAGNAGFISISGLEPGDNYTIVLAGYDAALDLWSSPVGAKNRAAGE